MKKFVIFIITALLITGCTKKEKDNNPPPSPPPQQSREQPPQEKKEEPKPPSETTVGSFQTEINDKSQGREENIALAVSAINKTELKPGKVFSFNKTVGPRTEKRGYKKAKVMVDGEYVMDFGGGVCQVSTTLYNAALSAGLKINEHHTHKNPVSYIEQGKDAAVNYDDMDLKFTNTKNHSLRIDIAQDGVKIYANIIEIQ